jgi:ATP-dependent protease ClpP protease subunit
LTEQLDALHDRYRVQNRVTPKRDWYRITNRDDSSTAEVFIFDEIGWFGITASDFITDLQAIDADSIVLHINSEGGEVFDGIAIYSTLRQHPAEVHVIVDSLAASIASVIAMAGDTVTVTPNATMMVHDGLALVIGNAADHRDMADTLDKISDNIASVYAERTGDTVDEWRDIMRAETWFNADEAVEAGLADRKAPTADTPAATFDISVFTDPPPAPVDLSDVPDPFDPAAVFKDAIRKAVSA